MDCYNLVNRLSCGLRSLVLTGGLIKGARNCFARLDHAISTAIPPVKQAFGGATKTRTAQSIHSEGGP